jgi:hypothetical protein
LSFVIGLLHVTSEAATARGEELFHRDLQAGVSYLPQAGTSARLALTLLTFAAIPGNVELTFGC